MTLLPAHNPSQHLQVHPVHVLAVDVLLQR
jgi:hypothetical protein